MQRTIPFQPSGILIALAPALITRCAIGSPSPSADDRVVTRRAAVHSADVWFLDIGQGSCNSVASPDDKSALLVNCGSSAAGGTKLADVVKWINMKAASMTTVTTIVSSPDIDHISLLDGTQGVSPASISAVSVGRSLWEYPAAFIEWARRTQTPAGEFDAAKFAADDAQFACGGAPVDLLTVNAKSNPNTGLAGDSKNSDSAMLRVAYEGNAVIFAGGAEDTTERSALDNVQHHKLDVTARTLLVVSHHGTRTKQSNSAEWLPAIQPRTVLFSARLALNYNHHRAMSSIVSCSLRRQRIKPSTSLAARAVLAFPHASCLTRCSAPTGTAIYWPS